MSHNNIIIAFLTAFLFSQYAIPVSADNDGLEFLAHIVQPEQRTSLVLDGGKPFSLKEGFTLDFDLNLRLEEHNFGYICRIIVNDTLNVDILANAGWGNEQISMIVKNHRCISVKDIRSLPGFDFGKWTHVSVALNPISSRISLKIGEYKAEDEVKLPQTKNVRISFGLSNDKKFASTDCPPMSLRNVGISVPGRGELWKWTLSAHGSGYVLDEHQKRKAIVLNPVWIADRHIDWKKISRLHVRGGRPQIARYEKDGDMGLYAATQDSLYYIPIHGTRPFSKVGYLQGQPYRSTSNSLVYIGQIDELISYSVTEDKLDKYNFAQREWSSDCSDLKFSHLHHNELLLPGSGELVVFGGYDEYTYHADLYLRAANDSIWTQKDLSRVISPRYLSAAAYSDGRMFILGGYGSRTGNQSEAPQFFNDFYSIDISSWKAERKWTFINDDNEVFGNSMIPDDEGKVLYALSFCRDRSNTLLRLNSFDIETGERKIFPGTIPYVFHDTDSWCTLLRDRKTGRLLALTSSQSGTNGYDISVWAIDWKPYLSEDILQEEESFPWLTFLIILSGIFVVAATYITIRRRHVRKLHLQTVEQEVKSEVVDSTIATESPDVKNEPAINLISSFKEPESDVLNIIGPFKWTGHDGDSRISKFSVMLRNIFLYIILHKVSTGSGVTSRLLDEVFWNSEPSEASNRRNVAMSRLRKLLSSEGIGELICTNGVWEIKLSEGIFCDLIRLEELIQTNDEPASLLDNETLDEIIVICRRGSLLSGIEDEWCDRFKSWYLFRITEFLEKVYSHPEIRFDASLSIGIAEVILANDPIDEHAIAIKCRALFDSGRKGQAKSTFEAFINEYKKMIGEPFETDFQSIIKL